MKDSSLIFPKKFRLNDSRTFRQTLKRRPLLNSPFFSIRTQSNNFDHPRLGLVLTRKVGQAVMRNRIKRMAREVFRQLRPELPNQDYVIFFKGPLEKGQLRLLRQELEKVFNLAYVIPA